MAYSIIKLSLLGKNEIPHSCTRVENITGRKIRY